MGNNNQEVLEMAGKAIGVIIAPQRQIIESFHGELPVKACDEFSLGYMIGICDGAARWLGTSSDVKLGIQIIICAINVAYGDNPELSLRERKFLDDVRDMSYTSPIEYLKGKDAGENDFNNTVNQQYTGGIPIPFWGWYDHVENS